MATTGGMAARDAVIAATKGGADLIAVEGDPLVDPNAVQRIDYVMARGRPIPMKGQ